VKHGIYVNQVTLPQARGNLSLTVGGGGQNRDGTFREGPLNLAMGPMGSTIGSSSGVWGGAAAETEFGAF